MRLRSATTADAEAILEIYNLEVLTSTVTFDLIPRTVDGQAAWLAERRGAYSAVIAEVDNEDGTPVVVGFGSLSRYRERAGYATTCEDSVYVHRDHQGEGIGSTLLTELVALATATKTSSRPLSLIVAVGDAGRGVLPPCGRCRQVMLDLHPDIQVMLADGSVGAISDLLPVSYQWREGS